MGVCRTCRRAWWSSATGSKVRYAGATEAVAKLMALAQALTRDYERFEALVAGEGSSG